MDKIVGQRMIPQFSTKEKCYLTQNNRIYEYEYSTGRLRKVCIIASKSKSLFGIFKEKVLRNWIYRNYLSNSFGIGHVAVMESSYLIVIYDGLYVVDLRRKNAKPVCNYDYKNFRISSPLKGGIAAHKKSQNFYFGEYVNGEKRAIRIFCIADRGQSIFLAYTFPIGAVQHVHGVFYDEYRNRLWVTTGDADDECAIYYTDDEFKTLIKLGGGDQTWRAVSVIPTKNELIWGMDAGKDAPSTAVNKIYRYDFSTQIRHEEATIGNPAYHAIKTTSGKIYLGVNFEPGRKQDTPEASAIWEYDPSKDQCWSEIRSFEYGQGRIVGASKYGYIYFPSGEAVDGKIIYSALNNKKSKFAAYMLTPEVWDN